MAYDHTLAEKIRTALAGTGGTVEEKNMFGGLTFMVNGKMCIGVSGMDLMCRIDPAKHDAAMTRTGTRAMEQRGRPYPGFVYVSPDGIRAPGDFDYWLKLAIEFNGYAPVSKSKTAKSPKKKE